MNRTLRRTGCVILLVLMIFLPVLTASAEDGSATLDSLHFEIALQEDGSARITETREIAFEGDRAFTRYGVNSVFTGPRAFEDWQVSIDGTPLTRLEEPDNDNRPENCFAVEENDGGNTVHIYFRQQGSGNHTFQIHYLVENAVKLHSDVGEFFWNLTGETGISDIGMLTATLTAPAGRATEEMYIWAHGPLNGTFQKQADGSAFLQVEDVPLGTIVDIRSTLPADCFTSGWVQPDEAFDEILAEEQALADSANAKREEETRAQAERDAAQEAYYAEYEAYWAGRNAWAAAHPILNAIQDFCVWIYDSLFYDILDSFSQSIAMLGTGVLVLGAFVGRLMRNPKRFRHAPAQSPRYCRDLPDDRPAPVVDRLVHFYDGKIDVSRQISATLLELNLKGLVHFQTVDGEVELLLDAQAGEALLSAVEPQEEGAQASNRPHIPPYQEALLKFLLEAADESHRIAIKDLEAYIQGHSEAAWNFRSNFEVAVSRESGERVKTERVKRPFFGRSRLPLLLPVVAGFLVVLICMGCSLYDGVEFGASLMIGAIAFALAAILFFLYRLGMRLARGRCEILDQQSEDDLALWQAFGRFLEDFTTFDEKELPEFSVWREYMVYAVAMGQGSKLAGALKLKYSASTSVEMPGDEDEMYRLLREMELYRAMDSIGRELAEARQPGSTASSDDYDWSDNWSDGSGGGGGFSDSDGGSDSGSGGDFID